MFKAVRKIQRIPYPELKKREANFAGLNVALNTPVYVNAFPVFDFMAQGDDTGERVGDKVFFKKGEINVTFNNVMLWSYNSVTQYLPPPIVGLRIIVLRHFYRADVNSALYGNWFNLTNFMNNTGGENTAKSLRYLLDPTYQYKRLYDRYFNFSTNNSSSQYAVEDTPLFPVDAVGMFHPKLATLRRLDGFKWKWSARKRVYNMVDDPAYSYCESGTDVIYFIFDRWQEGQNFTVFENASALGIYCINKRYWYYDS